MTHPSVRRFHSPWPLLGCVAAVCALVVACSDDSGSDSSGGVGAGSGTGADGSGADGSGGGLLVGGNGNTGGNGFEECEGIDEEATLVPVNMFLTFDKSGSMDDNNKWNNATGALGSFFGDPQAAGIRVALRFFPHDQPTSNCGCNIDSCANMLVPLGELTADPAPTDTQEQALNGAIASTSPGGNTPMYAALAGVIQAAQTQLAAAPNETAVAIIVTDGEPNGCNEDVDDIAALAAAGLASGVTTFSIGLAGSNESLMHDIALQGGSTSAFIIGNGNTSAELLAAFQAIQEASVRCDFVVPETSADGQEINPDLVNVVFNGETVPQVASVDDCGWGPGWYYDDPSDPANIHLCPAFCMTAQADEDAEINLKFGCGTTTAPN